MAAERLRDSMLLNAFSNVLSDFADLFQKELQLAKAEFASKLTTKLRGGVWIIAASALLLLAGAIFSEALAIWITTFGIALHVACLMVAVALLLLALVAFVAGRGDVTEDLMPSRSIHHIREDIRTTKEQLS